MDCGCGIGSKAAGGSIAPNSIDGADIRLANDQYLRWRNAADSGDINVIKVNASDQTVIESSLNIILNAPSLVPPSQYGADLGAVGAVYNIVNTAQLSGDGTVVHVDLLAAELFDLSATLSLGFDARILYANTGAPALDWDTPGTLTVTGYGYFGTLTNNTVSWGSNLPGLSINAETSEANTAGAAGITHKDTTGVNYFFIGTADASLSTSTSPFYWTTGDNAGTGDSGNVDIFSGQATGGGNSGSVGIRSQTSTSGNSGSIILSSGPASAGNSGDILLTANSIATTQGNLTIDARRMLVPTTVTATVGNVTIDKMTGTANVAAASTTLTVTNDRVTANSLVFATVRANDATAQIKNVVPAAGSFVINLTAAATANTSVSWWVINE
jgi:hypothetical protein